MRRKIGAVTVGVILIVGILGGYYAYGNYKENKYCDNYRLQCLYGYKSTSLFNSTINELTTASDSEAESKIPKLIYQLNQSSIYNSKQQYYDNEMMRYGTNDMEREYATSLLNQSKFMGQAILVWRDALSNYLKTKDINQFAADLNKTNNLDIKIKPFVDQREDIRVKNPDFRVKLDKIYQEAMNSTL